LRLVVALARATVGGADGVSVSLQRRGILATVAASDQTILDMDADQYATGEGPCVSASIEGRWFHAESLDEESRWPAFVPQAKTLGINSILSSPPRHENRPVGALNIYSHRAHAFTVKDQELAAVFAVEASTILAETGMGLSKDELTDLVGDALRSRQTIALAQGILMQRDGVSDEIAYDVIRRASVRTSQALRAVAADLVSASQRPREDEAQVLPGRDPHG
jgi:hypothetical protein